jgi:hypothetical protein
MYYPPYRCYICHKGGHIANNCKELPLSSPEQHHYGGEIYNSYKRRDNCEDESIYFANLQYSYRNWLLKALKVKAIKQLHQS